MDLSNRGSCELFNDVLANNRPSNWNPNPTAMSHYIGLLTSAFTTSSRYLHARMQQEQHAQEIPVPNVTTCWRYQDDEPVPDSLSIRMDIDGYVKRFVWIPLAPPGNIRFYDAEEPEIQFASMSDMRSYLHQENAAFGAYIRRTHKTIPRIFRFNNGTPENPRWRQMVCCMHAALNGQA